MSEEIQTAETAEIHNDESEAIVKYCSICGVQFKQMFMTNRLFKCGNCRHIMEIRTRKEIEEVSS